MQIPYIALVFERQETRLMGLGKKTVTQVVPIEPGTQVAFWEKMDDTGMHHHVIGTGPGSFIERIYHDDERNVRIDVRCYTHFSDDNPHVATIKLGDVVAARVINSRPAFMRGR